MSTENRDFKGIWIPKEVWFDKRLSALDKIILMEVDSLDQDENGCYASNSYIANFCQCSESKVSKSIAMLKDCGYLYSSFDGRQRHLKSALSNMLGRLVKNARQTSKKCQADWQKMLQSNNRRVIIESNIDENNISIVNDMSIDNTSTLGRCNKRKKSIEGRQLSPNDTIYTLGEFQNVVLTESECQKLKEKFPTLDIMSIVESMSAWQTNNKNYTNHYSAMLNWCKRESEKQKPKPNKNSFSEYITGIDIDL